jgi:Lipase (class 3)
VRRIPVDRQDVTGPLRSALGEVELELRQAALATFVGERLGVGRWRAARSIGWPPPRDGARATLVDLLTREAKSAPLEIIVTGHSKGGALAPALALWLVETRDRRDPTRRHASAVMRSPVRRRGTERSGGG